jgi:5'-nucleotidase
VTNDDGIDAPGLLHLARVAARCGYRVVVAAPRREASGSSAAMTAVVRQQRVLVEQRRSGIPDVPAYAVAGSPGYIVILATLGVFGPPPDVVLSGINRGANAGQAILHSGTVGATLTAAATGRRAMAVSLDVLSPVEATNSEAGTALAVMDSTDDATRHWNTAAVFAETLFPALFDAPAGTVFNLNVPDLPASRVAGLRRAKLSRFGQVQMAVAEVGEGFVRTAVEEVGARNETGTDLAGLADGHATVTPIRAIVEADDVRLPV